MDRARSLLVVTSPLRSVSSICWTDLPSPARRWGIPVAERPGPMPITSVLERQWSGGSSSELTPPSGSSSLSTTQPGCQVLRIGKTGEVLAQRLSENPPDRNYRLPLVPPCCQAVTWSICACRESFSNRAEQNSGRMSGDFCKNPVPKTSNVVMRATCGTSRICGFRIREEYDDDYHLVIIKSFVYKDLRVDCDNSFRST